MIVDYKKRCEELEVQNEVLRLKIKDLNPPEEAYWPYQNVFKLTTKEAIIFSQLMSFTRCRKQQLVCALYPVTADDPPKHIVAVFVSKIRKKLKAFGVELETLWGEGYRLDQVNKEKVKGFLSARRVL